MILQPQSFLVGEPAVLPMVEGTPVDAANLQPFSQRAALAADFNYAIEACVPVLFAPRGPAAIVRAVAFRVVDAVKRVFGAGSTAHVREKLFVRFPFVADSDSTTSVIDIPTISTVGATRPHLRPTTIFRRHWFAIVVGKFAMLAARAAVLDTHLTAQAAARFGVGTDKRLTLYRNCGATFAKAFPTSAAVLGWGAADDCQSSELLAGQV